MTAALASGPTGASQESGGIRDVFRGVDADNLSALCDVLKDQMFNLRYAMRVSKEGGIHLA